MAPSDILHPIKNRPAGPKQCRRRLFVISIAAAFASVSLLGSGAKAEDPKPKAKNIILFIGDGAGYNSWVATAMYLGRYSSETKKTNLLCDTSEWLKLACATYPLSLSTKPRKSGQQEPELVYDPKKAWDAQGEVMPGCGRRQRTRPAPALRCRPVP